MTTVKHLYTCEDLEIFGIAFVVAVALGDATRLAREEARGTLGPVASETTGISGTISSPKVVGCWRVASCTGEYWHKQYIGSMLVRKLERKMKGIDWEEKCYWSTVIFYVVQHLPSPWIELGNGSHHHRRRESRKGRDWTLPNWKDRYSSLWLQEKENDC